MSKNLNRASLRKAQTKKSINFLIKNQDTTVLYVQKELAVYFIHAMMYS